MQENDNMQKYIDEMMRLYKTANPTQMPITQEQNATPPMPTEPEMTPLPISPNEPLETVRELAPVELIEQNPLQTLEEPPINPDLAIENIDFGNYSDTGFLQIIVSSGEKAFPIKDAVVVIIQKTPLGEAAVNISSTDGNGKTPIIRLPAPNSENTTGEHNASTPFATYKAEVFSKGYHTVINENVPIFSNITSILAVNMIPLPTNASNRREITFYSDEPQF